MEFGLFAVDQTSRIVEGIIVPWNEPSRLNTTRNAPVKFRPGDLRVPRDPSVVVLNRMHDRYDPIGNGRHFEPRENGLYAQYRIAETEEGDAWLADHGDLVRLSPELRDIVRHPDGTVTATLTGSALVDEGSFASAGLFAIDPDAAQLDVAEDTPNPSGDGSTEDAPEGDAQTEGEGMEPDAIATVPGTVAPAGTASGEKKTETGMFGGKRVTRRSYFRMLEDVMGGRASYETRQFVASTIRGEAGMFALNDVDYSGAGGVGDAMTPDQWIGEVEGVPFVSMWADLFGAPQNLTSLTLGGFKWGVKPQGGTWTGNKDAIPSNTPTIVPVSDTAARWAGGHDIAREHRDFGTPGFFESYNAAMREDFEKWKDETIVRTELLAAATDVEADNPAGLTIGAGWSALIDGAASVVAAGFIPTFANVELSLWKTMMKVPSSDTLGYLEAAIGLDAGSLDGFRFRPVTGITTGHLIVGSRNAADVYQLPGSPIRAEALNIANGGIDIGFFGYAGLVVKNAAGIVDVAPYTP